MVTRIWHGATPTTKSDKCGHAARDGLWSLVRSHTTMRAYNQSCEALHHQNDERL